MPYTAKIKKAKEEFSLSDNSPYLDLGFDILLDGKVVAERRLAFPMGTKQEVMIEQVKQYLVMYENDHALAAKASQESEVKAASQKELEGLDGMEISGVPKPAGKKSK
jgi:hypothetical protein